MKQKEFKRAGIFLFNSKWLSCRLRTNENKIEKTHNFNFFNFIKLTIIILITK
jgi:hypothetical protein